MRRAFILASAFSATSWPSLAWAVTSASAQAGAMVGKLQSGAAALGALALVIAGYAYMMGHGDTQTLSLWAAGFGVILCAPYFISILS